MSGKQGRPVGETITRVWTNTDGSVAITFGFMSILLLSSVGIAVDASRALSIREALQSDLDSSLLSAAAGAGKTGDSVQAVIEKVFGANWRAKHGVPTVALSVEDGADKVTVIANVDVPTVLMGLVGFETMPVTAKAVVNKGGSDVEIALVLDTTASMTGDPLSQLKSAATDMIDTLYATASAASHVKVAVVPFAQYVNVGLANRNQNWISVPNDSSNTSEVCYATRDVTGSSNCRTEYYTYYNDGKPVEASYETCDYEYGPEYNKCEMQTSTQTWYGCVGSRNYPLNVKDESYSLDKIPGVMNTYCSTEILPLSSDEAVLKQRISELAASGETYIPAGLAWGWRVLSKEKPYDEGAPYAHMTNEKKLRKLLVLMTDGANTKSPTYPTHDGADAVTSDHLTVELCNNIKATGIEIFTVAFNVDDESVLDQMKGCASDISKFFTADSGEQLNAAFGQIAGSTMRLSLAE